MYFAYCYLHGILMAWRRLGDDWPCPCSLLAYMWRENALLHLQVYIFIGSILIPFTDDGPRKGIACKTASEIALLISPVTKPTKYITFDRTSFPR